jgi:hypothetical protein
MTLALVHWHIGISFAMDCRVARAATAKPALPVLLASEGPSARAYLAELPWNSHPCRQRSPVQGVGFSLARSFAIWSRIATNKSVSTFTALVSSVFSLSATDRADSTA